MQRMRREMVCRVGEREREERREKAKSATETLLVECVEGKPYSR